MLMRRMLALFIAVAFVGCNDHPPANEIRATGHVEATEVRLAPEVGGRIVELAVDEGDRAEAGAVILRLDARDAELAVQRAKAERSQAEAQLKLLQAGSRREDINQAQAQAQAARDELAAARAELASAEADLQRFEALLVANAGSRKQRDDAATRRDVARERVEAAGSRVRAADENAARFRAGARREEIEAARARVDAATAQVASVEETLNDTTLLSPIAGVVTEKLAEVGEVIAPRSPVVVVTDLANAWADVFVPEPIVPRIRLGQSATVFTDAGGSGIPGKVSYISPKAEFTPRNVQTAEERSKLVYRVRISVDNKDGILKQGMPVEAVIPLHPVQ
jgi:HlyD family secretion protein